MPAFAYLRKSTVHDASREVSPQVQEDAVRELAAMHGDAGGLALLSDWDKSGRLGRDKRPGYDALLSAIEDGRCTAVYSYSLSRLSRSLVELLRLVDQCTARRIPIRLRADSIDTGTASGMLLLQVLGAVSEFESTVARERALGALERRVKNGGRRGTVKSFGERDGEDVAEVLAAFDDAGSFSGAAKLLNERGVKPRTSKRGWWPSAVATVVERARPEYRRKERGVRAGGSDFLLARLLRCPTCGTRLTGTRDRDGRRVRYSCRLGTSLPHPRISVSEHLILGAVKDEVRRLRVPPIEQEEADTAKRADLDARRVRILDMYEAGDIDRAEKDRRLTAVQDALAALDSRRVVLALPSVDWDAPVSSVNAVLRALFDGIDLDPDTFQPVAFRWTVEDWRSPLALVR